jgi:hypothetical protein
MYDNANFGLCLPMRGGDGGHLTKWHSPTTRSVPASIDCQKQSAEPGEDAWAWAQRRASTKRFLGVIATLSSLMEQPFLLVDGELRLRMNLLLSFIELNLRLRGFLNPG